MTENSIQPAFPMYNELGNLHSEGLTKREYFANAAYQSLLASTRKWTLDQLAKEAVIAADKLLTELDRKQ